MPNSLRTGGVSMDLDALNITAQTDDGTNKFSLVFQLGALSSALEHAIPEQMFVTAENPGEAVSTVKALSKAAQQGQKIYHITQANLSAALADIRLDDATIQEIRDAIATGKEVITHTDPISVPGWSGAGYVVFDPAKGDGAWRIGGGENGSKLVLPGMMLAFLQVAVIFFMATVWLAVLAGVLGAIAHFLMVYSLQDDAASAVKYSIARYITLVGSFVLMAILTQTVFIAIPLLFVISVIFALLSVLSSIAAHALSVARNGRIECGWPHERA